MAKESGLGFTLTVDDSGGTPRDISNDCTNLSFGTPRGVQDVTGLDKSAMERIVLLADGTVTLNGVFNDAANMSHDVFKDVTSGSVVRTVSLGMSGQTLPMECLLTDYSLTRAQDGSLTWTVPAMLADGTIPTWA